MAVGGSAAAEVQLYWHPAPDLLSHTAATDDGGQRHVVQVTLDRDTT